MTVPRNPNTTPSWKCASTGAYPCWNDTMSVFCSGHSYLGDGRLVVAGGSDSCPPSLPCTNPSFSLSGTFGSRSSWIFDPSVLTGSTGGWAAWTSIAGPIQQRWYPSALTLADGSVLIAGGLADDCSGSDVYGDTMEVLSVGNPTAWTILPVGGAPYLGLPGNEAFRLYPHLRLLTGSPPGVFPTTADVFLTSHEGGIDLGSTGPNCNTSYRISRFLQSDITATPNSQFRRVEGNSAPVPGSVDRFILVGGRNAEASGPCTATASGTGIALVEDIQFPQNAGAAWTPTWGSLNTGRTYSNTVILPDESLFVVGGAQFDYQILNALPIPAYAGERLIPSPGQGWVVMAAQDAPRLYHSVAMLLPDGTVLSGGGDFYDPCAGAGCSPAGYGGIISLVPCQFPGADTPQFRFRGDVEIYSPPYLFRGPRPSFVGLSSTVMSYNGSINATVRIPPNATLDRFVLIRPGSVTHATDFEQRYVQLVHTPTFPPSPNWQVQTFAINSPLNGWQAQPGYWMLFAVTNTGIPSVATFVRVQ
jgi:galactose oxidase-like protein